MIYDSDAKPFAEVMARLGVALNREVTPAVLRVYFHALADLDLDEVAKAAAKVIQQDTFFPTVARIRECVAAPLGLAAARASRVFERITNGRAPRYCPRRGDYWLAEDVEAAYGVVARECFDAAGGTQAFQARTDRDLPFLRKAFIEAWPDAEAAERAGVLPLKHGPALPSGDATVIDMRRRLAAHTSLPDARARALPRGDQ